MEVTLCALEVVKVVPLEIKSSFHVFLLKDIRWIQTETLSDVPILVRLVQDLVQQYALVALVLLI